MLGRRPILHGGHVYQHRPSQCRQGVAQTSQAHLSNCLQQTPRARPPTPTTASHTPRRTPTLAAHLGALLIPLQEGKLCLSFIMRVWFALFQHTHTHTHTQRLQHNKLWSTPQITAFGNSIEGARPSPPPLRPSSCTQSVYTGAGVEMGRNTLPLFLFLALLSASSIHVSGSGGGLEEGKETWGYVSVRGGAHMFFWLYYTTVTPDYIHRPLVVWLQGGPGASSTGIGNFLEIGPKDAALKNRTYAWTKEVNVLFVDNPVGTGYSYVQDLSLLPKNNTAVAADLVTFMAAFFKKVPEFENVPLYIFSESYGGKMGARFVQALSKAVQQKKVRCQLAGLVMGDSWISPVDAVASWGPFLYATSLVDSAGKEAIDNKTGEVAVAVKAGKMADSTKLWAEAEQLIETVTNGVNFYNIMKTPGTPMRGEDHDFKSPELEYLYHRHVGQLSDDLNTLMNGPIRDKLKVIPANITWGGQSKKVFEALSEDFMNPAVKNVEMLLNTTSLKVVVYNGQLDLIVSTPGAQKWVENMHWAGTKQWVQSSRKAMVGANNGTVAFSKSFKNFTFYWILNAGHMAPIDAGGVAMRVMEEIVGTKK